jgi:UDP-3-O-[3-hydroxymyristoyl] N-acetylglucosamine deacetylase
MDGSAEPFVRLVGEAGLRAQSQPRRFLRIVRPVEIARVGKRIAIYPCDRFRITYAISFDHPLLRHQERTLDIDESVFAGEIAPARTFTFLQDVEPLRRKGFASGGSLDNAVVVGDAGVLNQALRFEDEFVRHKMLDAVGDLALLGRPILGHVVVHRGGHDLHIALAAKVLAERDAWALAVQPAAGARGAAGR